MAYIMILLAVTICVTAHISFTQFSEYFADRVIAFLEDRKAPPAPTGMPVSTSFEHPWG